MALGGEGGGLLVPHVDDAGGRIALDRGVVQREDVPTRQGEQRVDTEGAEGGQRQLLPVVADRGSGIVCHVTPESARTGTPIAIAPAGVRDGHRTTDVEQLDRGDDPAPAGPALESRISMRRITPSASIHAST